MTFTFEEFNEIAEWETKFRKMRTASEEDDMDVTLWNEAVKVSFTEDGFYHLKVNEHNIKSEISQKGTCYIEDMKFLTPISLAEFVVYNIFPQLKKKRNYREN